MQSNLNFGNFTSRLRAFIRNPGAESAHRQAQFDQLARELFDLQFEHNRPYRQFCRSKGVTPHAVEHWSQIPAVPTAAFKEQDFSCLPPERRAFVFHSSGTTQQRPSRHFHSAESMRLYETSLLPWFFAHMLPEMAQPKSERAGVAANRQYQFLALTPPPETTPRSSLVHMFATVHRELGRPGPGFMGQIAPDGGWELDPAQTERALATAVQGEKPLLLLGTAFSFVHLFEHLAGNNMSFVLPAGSRVLETGGYKGRSRVLSKAELHWLITSRLGIPPSHIVCEYGMSELSSQAYAGKINGGGNANRASAASGAGLAAFSFPHWARAQVISPESGQEVGDGEIGLLRVFDLANAHSVMAIQTEDLSIKRGHRFELIGRAALAEARGCSLMAMEG